MRKVEEIVKDHLVYLDAVQEFTDWLHSAKEELHRWSDMSGDSPATQKKLSKIKVRKQTDGITALVLGYHIPVMKILWISLFKIFSSCFLLVGIYYLVPHKSKI